VVSVIFPKFYIVHPMTGAPCVHEFIFKYKVKNQDTFTLPLILAKAMSLCQTFR